MATRRLVLIVATGTVGLLGGCVDRRFIVDTNAPGAQITLDGRPIGPSPADAWFEYPGKYEFRAVAPGYEPLVKRVRVNPRWFDYPGLDFVAEVLLPVRIQDVRHVRLELEPARPVRTDELLEAADRRRAQGQNLPPSTVPDDPGPPPGKVVPEPVGPRVLPPGVPPPLPTATESGVPATLPPFGPTSRGSEGAGGDSASNPFGYGSLNR